MLDAASGLKALKVEGVPADHDIGRAWDGVDCTLLFGATSLKEADRVELQQLKYSAANPNKPWTVARISSGKDGKPQTSLIRKLGKAFRAISKHRKHKVLETIKISLVTNQPVSDEISKTLAKARTEVPATYTKPWKAGGSKLHRLVYASGLSANEFERFATVMDVHGESGSRFSIEENTLSVIAELTDFQIDDTALKLRKFIRDRTLVEAASELVTRETVLIQFGVSDERALFPCPSRIRNIPTPVPRKLAKAVAKKILGGVQKLCLHGAGGVGKTVILQEIGTMLPIGSQMITFDCYGAGSYLDASKLRHLPRDAFLQLTNELAERFRLPALLEPNAPRDFARAFRRRVELAASVLRRTHSQALLVIAIDAADNSITAAQNQGNRETSFVTELMSFAVLPANVRVLITARSGQLRQLCPPEEFDQIEISPFVHEETAGHVERYWDAPPGWIEDFHELSGGVPRVQAYAFERAGEACSKALGCLLPSGKRLDQIFDEQFQLARRKTGATEPIERICGGLAVLPRPIPISELCHVAGLSQAQVVDICADLAPGLRRNSDLISFADEDFEFYVRQRGGNYEHEIRLAAADRFLANAGSDEYAAMNVAHVLRAAGEGKKLLDFVEHEPEPMSEAISDPVLRQEIRNQRLLTAISVCREAGNVSGAIRFVLIGAEAVGAHETIRSILAEFPRLTAKFARDTAARLILGEREHLPRHGPLLMHLLVEDAARGDTVGVREGWRKIRAWFVARRDDLRNQVQTKARSRAWTFAAEDAASALLAIAIVEGADAAISQFSRFRPFRFAISAGKVLIERLLLEGRFELAEEIAAKCSSWHAVFLLVPLARVGREIDLDRAALGIAVLKRKYGLDAGAFEHRGDYGDIGSYVIDTVLTAAEIFVGHGVHQRLSLNILAPFLSRDVRRIDKRHDHEVPLLDAILRCYCLSETIRGNAVGESEVLVSRPTPKVDLPIEVREGEERHDRKLKDVIVPMLSVYARRAKAIVGKSLDDRASVDLSVFEKAQCGDGWRLDRSVYSSRYRARLGEVLLDLIAIGANPHQLYALAIGYQKEFWPIGTSKVGELSGRLASIPDLHGDLLERFTSTSDAMRRERIGAREKSHALAAIATTLISISPDDAEVVFQQAVEIASGLDEESAHQIRVINSLVGNGHAAFKENRRVHASAAAEIVNDAAIRLRHSENFPWEEAISSIARLDVSTALASVARWDDGTVENLRSTMPSVILVGLETSYFNCAQAAALLTLHDHVPLQLLTAIIECAEKESDSAAFELVNEFSYDSVVGRVPFYSELEPRFSRHSDDRWIKEFSTQAEFRRTLKSVEATPLHERQKPENPGLVIRNAYVWDRETLVDATKLLEVATDLLAQMREAGGFASLGGVLEHAGDSVPPGSRTKHLDALIDILDKTQDAQLVDVILPAARNWFSQPAVKRWCRASLPPVVAGHLPKFARYLPWEDGRVGPSMELIAESGGNSITALLEGLQRHADSMKVEAILAVSGLVGSNLAPKEAADLCAWYLTRLLQQVDEADRESIRKSDIPIEAPQAVGRFLYAYMSDVDIRRRWRVAHALRRLARLGEESTLNEVIALYDRVEEPAFRAGNEPFYWLAARLWLIIALDRIAEESPDVIASHGRTLFEICYCDDFPHLLIRDYAADACRKLIEIGSLTISAEESIKLENVNSAKLSGESRQGIGNEFFENNRTDKRARRFDFDSLDTLRYWYENWMNLFEGVTASGFIESAEKWIVDKWGVVDQPTRASEPRKNRFPDRSFYLWSNGHGRLPTLERYQNHLEWHAMWCAAGELSQKHPVLASVFGDEDVLASRISERKLTHPPHWLSDFSGPTPLQRHRWRPADADMENWLDGIADSSFTRELLPEDRPGWVAVSAYITDESYDREETLRITTGLVTPASGHALVRALQTTLSQYQFYICPEGHEKEIEEPDFVLKGWLTRDNSDLKFDAKDSYCNGAGTLQGLPGKTVTRVLGLVKRRCTGSVMWSREGTDAPTFVYEAWGKHEPEETYFNSGVAIKSSGCRLLVRSDDLAEFLDIVKKDLIMEIGITRNEKRRSGKPYGTEGSRSADFDRVVLLRRSGTVEAAERSFEAWRTDSSRTGN